MRINIKNVEEVIFMDKEAWDSIPKLAHLRDQWRISKMTPSLRAMGLKSLADFLHLAKPYEESLSKHFGSKVTIDSLDPSSVKNTDFLVSDDHIEADETFSEICLYRKGEMIGMTMWR